MIRHIYVVTFVFPFFFIIKPMELEDTKVGIQHPLLELLEKAEPVLGGVAQTIDQAKLLACQDQLIAFTHVMSSVINGLELEDDHVVVPGNIRLISLNLASDWISFAFHLAEKKHDEGSEFVTSDNLTIRACQMMFEKLWQFGLCLDLEDAMQDDVEILYCNRMIRIGALLNYRDPRKRDVSLLRQYAKIQVLQQQPTLLPAVSSSLSEDVTAAFEQSAINLSFHTKKGKKTGCFSRCISKNKHQEKSK